MKPARSSLSTLSRMMSWRSRACLCTMCRMGCASGNTAKWCSITSLGTLGMSDGCHANTSAFARRKVMSTSSYLGSSDQPTFTILAGLASRGISLIGPASLAAIRVLIWVNSHCSRGGWSTTAVVCTNSTHRTAPSMSMGTVMGPWGARHLDHHVNIVNGHHELGQRGLAKYRIVWDLEVGYVEHDHLRPEVIRCPKGYRQVDLT